MTNQNKDSKGRNLYKGESQLKDGRYRYRYTDKSGNRKSVYAWKLVKTDKTPNGKKTTPCLRELERQIQKDLDDKIQTYIADHTNVYELMCRYLSIKATLANSTLINYQHMAEKNIKPSKLGAMKVSDVKKSDIKEFYKFLYSDKGFAATTIQLYQNLIFPAFQMAVDDDIIRKNPCKDCMKDYVKKCGLATKYPLSRDEQKVLLNYVKNHNIFSKYYIIIAFMLGTGCRIGETIGLTWNDIDFENKVISINHQIIYKRVAKDKRIKHYAELPKNRTSRIVPLQDEIYTILMEHKRRTYFISKTNDYTIDGYSSFVFLNDALKLYTPNTLTRAFHSIRDAYNNTRSDDEVELPDFSSHTFRHTFCTRMAENGLDVKVLQTIMGHKTLAVTMEVYNHVDNDRIMTNVKGVGSALAM